jgi:dipeptidyl aminopeptidase/acylaminoacyl peptidase
MNSPLILVGQTIVFRGLSASCLALAVCLSPVGFAQPKPTLTPADYAKWETLVQGTLSSDGKWLAHEIRRTDRNDELRVSATAGGKTYVVAFCSAAAFSADSQWLACESTVSEAEQDRLRKARRPVQNKLSMLDLATGAVTSIDDVQSFAFAGEKAYVAFRRYPPARDAGAGLTANAANAAPGGRGGGGGRGGAGGPGGDTEIDPVGSALTVRNLATGIDTTFGGVTSYSWQENGTNLAMAIGLEGRAGNALQVFDPRAGSLRVLDSGPALFADLAWRKESSDLAALRSMKKDGYEGESYAVVAWKNLGDKRAAQVEAPKRIVAARAPQWSEDGSTVYVGLAEWSKKPESQRSDEDPSTVEVWHWKDVNVISEQKLTTARDRDRNALAAWHIESGRLVPLSANPKEDVRLSKRGPRALALDGTPYDVDSEFGRRFTDVYQVNLETGARAAVASHLVPPVDFSPGGRYVLQFKGSDFWVYDLDTGASRDISKEAPTGFTNKENDYPVQQKPSYGVAGWTKDDHSVIVYDAYDLWELFPDGTTKPRRLTDGSAEEVRHRYVRMSPRQAGGGRGGRGGRGGGEDPEWIDLGKPLYLSLEGRWTKRTGYARLENGKVERLVWLDKGVRGLEKAKDADVLVYQSGAWDDSPNFFAAGLDLKNPRRVSDTNPFAPQYAWGRAELIDFKNSKGDRLQGALYYPANYERGKQYPMIVQIYEIESNQLHNWTAPSERATYNPAVWTQKGYFVYRPDIVFRPREPGVSALDCVTAGVKKVLDTGMVDTKKVGLVGHSWGGYETTFIATQTDLFAAAVAGGPLTNLASSYGEIYWNNGGPETDHAEVGQERMEVPLYEDPQSYIRNSAVYFANKLKPPLLLSVGDHDGASDWHQDIELYNSARRAGKTVVMLVYEGENHSVAQKANQLDYHRRINDWFDHYLKGNDPQNWITKGVTVLDRERELKSNGQSGGRGGAGNPAPVGTASGGGQF